MLTTMRIGTFETNSSSTHTLCICTEDEFKSWERGEIEFDRYEEVFGSPEDRDDPEDDWRYLSYTDVFDWNSDKLALETFKTDYTTPGGERIVAFGWHGMEY